MRGGFMQIILVSMRSFGTAQTFCKKCSKVETFKLIDTDGSHSYLCGCGCTIYRFHYPDDFHEKGYFVKSFVPATEYDPNYKGKNEFEKEGFHKKIINGKIIYER